MARHYDSKRHRDWAAKVLRKDKYLCQRCLRRYGRKVPARVAHHIKPLEFYPEFAYDVSNGEALCFSCHNEEHPEKGGARFNPPVFEKKERPKINRGATPFPNARTFSGRGCTHGEQ